MRKILFGAGYHEWIAFVGKKQLFGGLYPSFLDEPYTKEDIENEARDIVNWLDDLAKDIWNGYEEAQDHESFDWKLWRDLTEEETDYLVDLIAKKWGYCYL